MSQTRVPPVSIPMNYLFSTLRVNNLIFIVCEFNYVSSNTVFYMMKKILIAKSSRLGRRNVASMTALSWLEHARKFAEMLPNDEHLQFSSCQTKSSIYLEMKEDLRWNEEIISPHFLNLWREEMKHISTPEQKRTEQS